MIVAGAGAGAGAGADAPLGPEAVAALADGAELELSEGGQPAYWWLLSAE